MVEGQTPTLGRMMLRRIHESERYPFYSIGLNADGVRLAIEVTREDLVDYERVLAEFEAWQDRLSAAAQDAHDHNWVDVIKLDGVDREFVCAGCGKRKREPR